MSSLLLFAISVCSSAAGPIPAPAFYTSSDCTGSTDPASAKWSYLAEDNVAVKPFSDSEKWFSGHAINTCMTDSSITYSVMLKIDTTACPNNGNNALQFSYWASSSSCEGTPTSTTTLTAGTCVTTPLGSAKFKSSLTESDLCKLWAYRTAVQTGGLRIREWEGSQCNNGASFFNTTGSLGQQPCGNIPDCGGCCPNYVSCQRASKPDFFESLVTCKKVGSSWEMALANLGFSDDKCTNSDNHHPLQGVVRKFGSCSVFKVLGVTYAAFIDLKAPLTAEIFCDFVLLNAKRNISGFVTYSDFDKMVSGSGGGGANGGFAVHPMSVLTVVVLFFAVALF
eukprot:TRINITY_DN49_c0_g2_i2.p1 TRINITY_DN49_c0_g2~~TRINITY_DN49_c0_g2_i2.p1  ORF type:complete len:338 (+),score=108.42 TRINITY_DN49_c0_g2_i2:88-1101(+)